MAKDPKIKRDEDYTKIVKARKCARNRWRDYKLVDATPKKNRALVDLEDAAETMELAGWHTERDPKQAHEVFKADAESFDKAIKKAIKAGLTDHPLIRDWISNKRTFGEWDNLRPFKRLHLEKGVIRTPTKEGFWIRFEAQSMSDDGKGPQEIRRKLIKKLSENDVPDWFEMSGPERSELRKYLARVSRQAFRQKLKRLGW